MTSDNNIKYRVMKAINTLSVLIFFLVAVACSSESDTIMNDIDKEVATTSEVYASVDFSFITTRTGATTKASSSVEAGDAETATDTESSISNCYIAVFEYSGNAAGKYLGSRSYDYKEIMVGTSGYEMKGGLIFKIPEEVSERKDLLFVAIANVNPGTIPTSGEMTYSRLMGLTLTENPTVLVKVGEIKLEKNDAGDYLLDGKKCIQISKNILDLGKDATKAESSVSYANVVIPVKQRTAAIMLKSFTLKKDASGKEDSTPMDVTITNVTLSNTKMLGKVSGELTSYSGEDYELFASEFANLNSINEFDNWGGYEEYNKVLKNSSNDINKYRFYTYENRDDETKIKMNITYEYSTSDGKIVSKEFSFTIKSPSDYGFVEEVWANHLYEISVEITNEVASVGVECYTQNWKDGGSYNAELRPSSTSNNN